MTIADLKAELHAMHADIAVADKSRDRAVAAVVARMKAAIDALPDTRLLRSVPTIPRDIVAGIEREMKTCSDYPAS